MLKGNGAKNCLATNGNTNSVWGEFYGNVHNNYQNTFTPNAVSINPGTMKISYNGSTTNLGAGVSWHFYTLRFPLDNCGYGSDPVDLSDDAKRKIEITAMVSNTTKDIVDVSFFLYGNTAFADGHPATDPRPVAKFRKNRKMKFTATLPEKDWQGNVIDLTGSVALVIEFEAVALDFTIYNIKVGDVVTSANGMVDLTTDISNPEINNNLVSVYPNPTKDMLNVDLSALEGAYANLKLFNSNGSSIMEAYTSSGIHTFNVSGLEKGIYLLQVNSGNKISNKKIVIE
ncbi:MAG: T9SS type A sorting domain-containing protein [Cytophagaceae bacterium]|nr:T9SS type A sorting domain-containing protein [Cytophagaceae bacterium]MDW8455322.1 T9SS type A sorting domain-containing protein [Cytophagaceae bacterium]